MIHDLHPSKKQCLHIVENKIVVSNYVKGINEWCQITSGCRIQQDPEV